MSILSNSLLLGADAAAGGYEIERSLRFNSSDSAYLSRTPASASNRTTWTWAGWVKTASFTRTQFLFGAEDTFAAINANGTSSDCELYFNLRGSSTNYFVSYAPKLRDPSAWYHLVFAVDTTQGTPANRLKVYINGVQATAAGGLGQSFPPQNDSLSVNNTVAHTICGSYYFDGYLADVIFVDGSALPPSSFGEFDTNNVWQPKAFSGSYGTNGFHLPFSDNSTAAALGTDTSSNGNDWTVNNLSVTAGAGNDSLVDSPTNGSQTDTGVGGEVRGNYATLNPLSSTAMTLSNGNLDCSTGTDNSGASGTVRVSTGKWFFEATTGSSAGSWVGWMDDSYAKDDNDWAFATGRSVYANGGLNGNGGSYADTYTTNDVIGCALDLDNGTVAFYKNGVSQGTMWTGLTGTNYRPFCARRGYTFNFGQRPFAYTAPSGFKALCTTNLPEPTIADGSTAMDVKLYTGNGSTQTISGLNFSPDLVWIKRRDLINYFHELHDIVRGTSKALFSNSTYAESARDTLTSFNSDGFTVGTQGGVHGGTNASGGSYVGWTWDAGSSTVTNTAGSITSQVRANAGAGFSVVTWTGTASAGTIGHGLGVAPALVILKFRGTTSNWSVYHSSVGNTKRLILNSTASEATGSTFWNNTSPTSTVFSVGGDLNDSTTIVAYCFAPVAGYSSFGSYTGNGSADGPFVYTGFRSRWLLIKCSSSDQSGNAWWLMFDSKRLGYNPDNAHFGAQASNAEFNASSIDLTSNGFKLRDTNTSRNASGATYTYAAFAEHPFATSRAR